MRTISQSLRRNQKEETSEDYEKVHQKFYKPDTNFASISFKTVKFTWETHKPYQTFQRSQIF